MAKMTDTEKLNLLIRDDPEISGKMYARMKMHINEATVVHGRWVSSGCGFDCCSACRKVYTDGYFTAMGIKPRAQFKYCPNCGAKMDGDGNG